MIIRYPTIPARRQQVYATLNGSAMCCDFSWAHAFQPSLLLTVSPFYHFNLANY
jgi:hypothetical protein